VPQTSIDLGCVGKEKEKKTPKPKLKWKPPYEGRVRINTDASFIWNTMSGATMLVVGDHLGNTIRAQARWKQHAANAHVMEVPAIREGVNSTLKKGSTSVIIESDSKEVVNLCNGDGSN
jgi:ribonuclease HI